MESTNENNLIENKECKISYSGNLYKNNSKDVTIVFGFGNNWDYTSEKLMTKAEDCFYANIKMLNYDKFNFCFRNENYEWDNNNYQNYCLPIEPNLNSENDETSDNKNDLLNNILNDNNAELDYVHEFNIDKLIEDILSPLLEEKILPIEENDNVVMAEANKNVENNASVFEANNIVEANVENNSNIDNKTILDNINSDYVDNLEIDGNDDIIKEFLDVLQSFTPISKDADSESSKEVESDKDAESSSANATEEFSNQELDFDSNISNFLDNIYSNDEASNESNTEKENTSNNVNDSTALTVVDEDKFIICSRQLTKFYLFRKKIKLALYKIIYAIPRMLNKQFNENNDK